MMPPAPDLSTNPPRSPFEELDGYAWLPRMIDKARADYAGTRGEYSAYPCPGDKGFLGAFKLNARSLGEVIKSGADDAQIASYVRGHAKGNQAAYRASLRKPSRNPIFILVHAILRAKLRRRLGSARPDIDWSRVDTISKVLAVEEGHPLPEV